MRAPRLRSDNIYGSGSIRTMNRKALHLGFRCSWAGPGRWVAAFVLSALAMASAVPSLRAARLTAPRAKVMSFSPEELELGATAITVSERSEPMRMQFADSGFRQTPVVAAADISPRHGPIATSLDAAITVSAIQTWRFEEREKSADDLVTRIDATHRALNALASQRPVLRSDEAQNAFNSALRGAENAEQRLRQSLQAARAASAADWNLARSAVSADFVLYANAVSEAEAAMAAGSAEDSGKKLG